MTSPRLRTRNTRRRILLLLAVLVPAWAAAQAPAAGAESHDHDPQERAADPSDELVQELGRVLGMTPAEIEALGLSPAEMRNLLAGFAEETVVVGSRAQPRSATESAVPVDVLSATDLVRRGAGGLQDQLRTLIPSFSVNRQPISGSSTLVRPAMLRNLAPDHTLVLVNGKRRHRSSVVDWHGGNGVAFGSQGPDISAIPAIALRQVEVLRDGAAAQYGSDAIAGVLNFQLKDARQRRLRRGRHRDVRRRRRGRRPGSPATSACRSATPGSPTSAWSTATRTRPTGRRRGAMPSPSSRPATRTSAPRVRSAGETRTSTTT